MLVACPAVRSHRCSCEPVCMDTDWGTAGTSKKVRDKACSPVHWAHLGKAHSWWSHSRTCERFFTVPCIFHLGFSSSSMTHFEISWKLKHLSSIGTLFSHSKYTKQKISLLQRGSVEKRKQNRVKGCSPIQRFPSFCSPSVWSKIAKASLPLNNANSGTSLTSLQRVGGLCETAGSMPVIKHVRRSSTVKDKR